ncbi:WXG100-like domain-containing protein [Streptosporangium sandarakinum]
MALTLSPDLQAPFGLLGVPWPPEDEDHIRACGAALRACAVALDDQTIPTAHGAVGHAARHNAGDHIDALTGHWADYHADDARSGHLQSLTVSLHALADGCDLFARIIEIVKAVLIFLATYVLLALVWAASMAVVSGGLAALQARGFVMMLRTFARKAVATLRGRLERYFGGRLIRAVETRLRRVLHAKPPSFPVRPAVSPLRRVYGVKGLAASSAGVTWLVEGQPESRPRPPLNSPEEGPRDGRYDLGPARDPGIPYDDPWPYDPDAKPSLDDHAAWHKWRALQLAEEATPGFDEAAATFKHYLEGDGSDYRIDYDKAYRDDKLIRDAVDAEIRRAQENVERIHRETGRRDFQMTGEPTAIKQTETKNWEFALGRHSIWGSADVRIDGDQATMDITVHAYDRYNFNREDKWINQENGRFETLGWARSYDTHGSLKRRITWTLPGR